MKRLKYTRYMYTNSLTMGSGILKCLMDARNTAVGSIYTFELIKLVFLKQKLENSMLYNIAVDRVMLKYLYYNNTIREYFVQKVAAVSATLPLSTRNGMPLMYTYFGS